MPVNMAEIKQEVSLPEIYRAKVRIKNFFQTTPCRVSSTFLIINYYSTNRRELFNLSYFEILIRFVFLVTSMPGYLHDS